MEIITVKMSFEKGGTKFYAMQLKEKINQGIATIEKNMELRKSAIRRNN